MIQDLHSHTYYSFDSKDRIERVVETAIAGGVTLLGITDHNYGVACGRTDLCYDKGPALDADYGRTLVRYCDHVNAVKEKYKNRIKILCGLEISTVESRDAYCLPSSADVSFFDYVLVENLTDKRSVTHGDIVSFAKRCGCPTGIAHTDLFALIDSMGEEPNRYLKKLADNGVFWELNVNYDSLHGFRPYDYVTAFFKNKAQQEAVKRSGMKVSIGFDSHIASEYKPDRVKTANTLVKNMGIRRMFEGI